MNDEPLPVEARTICVSGRELMLTPLIVGQLVEVERRILSEMRDPLQDIAARWDEFNDAQRRQLLEAAFAHLSRAPAVPITEIVAWMNSPRGTAYACWLAARASDPRLDWETCEQLVMAALPDVLEAIQRVLAPQWWEDLLGNSPGQTQLDAAAVRGAACTAS
ncbi:MAG: hypothetical protein SGJ19_13385 [Planctomycetia bacterium]|nr:hypothetical protein [Planctomycetia bacterium]